MLSILLWVGRPGRCLGVQLFHQTVDGFSHTGGFRGAHDRRIRLVPGCVLRCPEPGWAPCRSGSANGRKMDRQVRLWSRPRRLVGYRRRVWIGAVPSGQLGRLLRSVCSWTGLFCCAIGVGPVHGAKQLVHSAKTAGAGHPDGDSRHRLGRDADGGAVDHWRLGLACRLVVLGDLHAGCRRDSGLPDD